MREPIEISNKWEKKPKNRQRNSQKKYVSDEYFLKYAEITL